VIVVTVYRPEAADGDAKDHLDGVEILGVFDNVREDSVMELVNSLADAHPTWQFDISPGHEIIAPEDVLAIHAT